LAAWLAWYTEIEREKEREREREREIRMCTLIYIQLSYSIIKLYIQLN